MFEPEISVNDARGILGLLDGFQGYGDQISKEAHGIYTAMFWEAPERIVEHFLSKVPREFKLNCICAGWGLLRSTKYSRGFLKRLIECFGSTEGLLPELIAQFRPDLAEEQED